MLKARRSRLRGQRDTSGSWSEGPSAPRCLGGTAVRPKQSGDAGGHGRTERRKGSPASLRLSRWPRGGVSRARACLPSSPAPGGNRAAVKTRAQGVSCGLFSAGSHSPCAGERRSRCWSLLGSLSDKPWRVAKRGPRGRGGAPLVGGGAINCAQETCFSNHEPCKPNTLSL